MLCDPDHMVNINVSLLSGLIVIFSTGYFNSSVLIVLIYPLCITVCRESSIVTGYDTVSSGIRSSSDMMFMILITSLQKTGNGSIISVPDRTSTHFSYFNNMICTVTIRILP